MSRTVLSSASKDVIIGFDQPFCIIGERINPTGRKKLSDEMKAGDYSTVAADALAQVAAGVGGAGGVGGRYSQHSSAAAQAAALERMQRAQQLGGMSR